MIPSSDYLYTAPDHAGYLLVFLLQLLLLFKGHCVAALLRRPERHCLRKVGVGINANLRVVCLLFVTENQGYLSGIRQTGITVSVSTSKRFMRISL